MGSSFRVDSSVLLEIGVATEDTTDLCDRLVKHLFLPLETTSVQANESTIGLTFFFPTVKGCVIYQKNVTKFTLLLLFFMF
jgi:hypothetical protein